MYSILNLLLIIGSQISDVSSLDTNVETLAAKFAPHLRFDSEANNNAHGGLPTYFKNPVGESFQNTNTDVSTIPTYWEIYGDTDKKKIRIKYKFHYAYQASCLVDGDAILGSLPNAIKEYVEDWVSDLNGDFGFDEDFIGEHTDGDNESISVWLDCDHSEDTSDECIIEKVWYGQHGDGYEVNANQLEYYYKSNHPVVYIGVKSHGNYHSKGGTGGCGYFHDFRDGSIHIKSWKNLIYKDDIIPKHDIMFGTYNKNDPTTEGNGVNWEYCQTSTQINNNPKLCTPLKCEEKSTGCLVLGVSDGVDAAADIHDKYLIIESTSAPGCNCITKYGQKICKGENIKIDVCTPDI
eukprot:850575_1